MTETPSAQVPSRPPLPPAERAEQLAGRVRRPDGRHAAPWRGGHLKVPVVVVPNELLVYRVENGRLIAELREQARAGGEALEALGARQDALDVQQRLHRLLVAKAGDPGGPILQELERQREQTEPLLVTADGVVVNGNRRLAAMRELLARDGSAYAAFAEVSAAVLPPEATPSDLEAVEAALQMAPETKLAYGWVNRRLKLRRQLEEVGLPVAEVVEASRLSGPPQLERELAELALVEDYLSAYCREPGRYSLVGDAERLFVGLHERLVLLPEDLRAVWRQAGFAMISARAKVSGPMDRHFPFAAPAPGHLPTLALRRFAEEQGLLRTGEPSAALEPAALQDLRTLFADPSRASETGPALAELIERVRSEFLEQHTPLRLLTLAAKLEQTMARIAPEHLDERQRRILRNHLAAVRLQAGFLLGEEAERPARAGGLAGRLGRLLRG